MHEKCANKQKTYHSLALNSCRKGAKEHTGQLKCYVKEICKPEIYRLNLDPNKNLGFQISQTPQYAPMIIFVANVHKNQYAGFSPGLSF